jgi:hypothetical protein
LLQFSFKLQIIGLVPILFSLVIANAHKPGATCPVHSIPNSSCPSDPLALNAICRKLSNPSFGEWKWAARAARKPTSQAGLLVHRKMFDVVGWFLSDTNVSLAVVEYMARRIAIESKTV